MQLYRSSRDSPVPKMQDFGSSHIDYLERELALTAYLWGDFKLFLPKPHPKNYATSTDTLQHSRTVACTVRLQMNRKGIKIVSKKPHDNLFTALAPGNPNKSNYQASASLSGRVGRGKPIL